MEYRMVVQEAHDQTITCMVHNPHRRELFTGSEDFDVKMWDLETGRLLSSSVAHTGWITGMVFCKRLKLLLTSSLDGTVVVWGASMKVVDRLQTGEPIYSLGWNPRRQQVMVGHERKVKVYVIREEQGSNLITPNQVFDKLVSTSAEEHDDIVSSIASCEARFYSVGYDKKLVIYDSLPHSLKLQVAKRIHNAHDAAISCMSYGKDADNAWIITGSFDRVVKMWSLDGHCLQRFDGFSSPVTGLCYISPTQTLWVAANASLPVAYDPKSGINVSDFMGLDVDAIIGGIGSKFIIRSLLFIPESNEAVAITTRRTLIFWRYNPAAPITTLQCMGDTAEALTFTSKEPILIFSGGVDNVTRWERIQLNSFIYSQEPLQFPKDDKSISQSSGGSQVLTRAITHRNQWLHKTAPVAVDTPIKRQKQTVLKMIYYEPLDLVVAALEEKRILIWGYNEDGLVNDTDGSVSNEQNDWGADVSNRVAGMSCKMQLQVHHDAVLALAAFSYQDKHYLLSSGTDRRICLIDLATGMHVDTFRDTGSVYGKDELAADGPIQDLVYSDDRKEFAYASTDKQVYVRRFGGQGHPMQLVAVLQGHEAEVTAVCWNTKNRQWVSASEDRTIRIWAENEPTCVQVIINNAEVTALCIDAFNGCIIAGGRDRALRVYDGDALVQKNIGHKDEIRAITHLFGRNQYATASWDGTIKVWNAYIRKGQRRHEYTRVNSASGIETVSIFEPVMESLVHVGGVLRPENATSSRLVHTKEPTKADVRDDLEHVIQNLQRSIVPEQASSAAETTDKIKRFSI